MYRSASRNQIANRISVNGSSDVKLFERAAEEALDEAKKSYSPYSRCPSGVAIITHAGDVHSGGYIESAAYNPSLSPFHAAVIAAFVGGMNDFDDVQSKENLFVSGPSEALGADDTDKALALPWSIGDSWVSTIEIPVGQNFTFRLFKMTADNTVKWEGEAVRTVKAAPFHGLNADCIWGGETITESYQLTVPFAIKCKHPGDKGDKMFALGNLPLLGDGFEEKALALSWSMLTSTWSVTTMIPVGTAIAFRNKPAALRWSMLSSTWSATTMIPVGTAIAFRAMEHTTGYSTVCIYGNTTETTLESHKLSNVEKVTISVGAMYEEGSKKAKELYDEGMAKAKADIPVS
eukprot:gene25977-11663_t